MKKILIAAFILLAFILLPHQATAKFVCGKVNSSAEFSADWLNIMVYYPEDSSKYTVCKATPEENKYCCDLEAIPTIKWKVGKNVSAEVYDAISGYVAGPVSLSITPEGYDIFPEMSISKALDIISPKNEVYLNLSSILLNVTSFQEYNNLKYTLYYYDNKIKEESICNNCNQAELKIENLSYGSYSLEVEASGRRNITKKIDFDLLEYLSFSRSFECDGCVKNYIPRNREVKITVLLRASHNISGMLKDFFPLSWETLTNESFEDYSETHKAVSWEVQGNNITKSYFLKSPNIIFPRKYSFWSEFKDTKSEISYARVFGLIRWPAFFYILISPSKEIYNKSYQKASPNEPLIIKGNESQLIIALYPKKEIKKAFALIRQSKDGSFEIISNIKNTDIENISFFIRLPEQEKHPYLAVYNDNKIENFSYLRNEDKFVYYQASTGKKGKFKILIE